jgi:hypothetical protein
MLGKDIITFITERKMKNKEVIINFSYKGNGSFVLKILDVNWDADENNTILNIGKIDNMINIEDYHVLLNNIVTNYRLGYITKDGAYQEMEDIENKFINGSEPDGDLVEAVSNAIDNINNN